jgi:predicted nucleotidyltransferase
MGGVDGRLSGNDDSSLLREIIRRIVAAIDPDRIILFGSRARGEGAPASDYDLLAVKSDGTRTLLLEQAAYSAMLGIPASVDIVVETPERLERFRNAPGMMVSAALREGVTVYERDTQ